MRKGLLLFLYLGGRIEEKVAESGQTVPGPGDISIIGVLFRSKQLPNAKLNLLVFIRAAFIKDLKKILGLSCRRYDFIHNARWTNVDGDDLANPLSMLCE